MIKKDFEAVFQSYFHNKYSFENFLNTKLTESKNFKFSEYQTYTLLSYIKDPNTNKLTKASLELKEYHTFLKNVMFKFMNIRDNVYSYVPNKSTLDAVSLHKYSKSYFKTDIKNFFNSIHRDLVLKYVKNNVENYPLNKNVTDYIEHIIDLIVYDDHLPVGFVTSPNISNAVLFEFDNSINEYCKSNQIIYSRYSDDLIFSSNDYTSLKNLPETINDIFASQYNNVFKINEDKTQFLDKTNKLTLLGLIITPDGHITVSKHIKENIKQLIYYFLNDKDKFNSFLSLRYEGDIVKAYGSLNYINDIDKNYVQKLKIKYGNYIVDKFLHGDKKK